MLEDNDDKKTDENTEDNDHQKSENNSGDPLSSYTESDETLQSENQRITEPFEQEVSKETLNDMNSEKLSELVDAFKATLSPIKEQIRNLESRNGDNYNIFMKPVGAAVANQHGDTLVNSSNTKQTDSHTVTWKFSQFELGGESLRPSDLCDFAYVVAMGVLSGTPQTLADQAADTLATRMQQAFFSDASADGIDVAQTRSYLRSQIGCKIGPQTGHLDSNNSSDCIIFESDGDDIRLLQSAFYDLRMSKSWKPVFLDWLRKLGRSNYSSLRIAAGRAAGVLAINNFEYVKAELFGYWLQDASIDALDESMTVALHAQGSTADEIHRLLLDWATGKHSWKHTLASGRLAAGVLGQTFPEISFEILTALIERRIWSYSWLALYGYTVWFFSSEEKSIYATTVIEHFLELEASSDTYMSSMGKLFFLSTSQLLCESHNTEIDLEFFDVLHKCPSSINGVAQLFNSTISPNPRAKWALGRFKSLITTGMNDQDSTFELVVKLVSSMYQNANEQQRARLNYWMDHWSIDVFKAQVNDT